MKEHTGLVTFKGNPITLLGEGVTVGKPAPDFTATGQDMKPVTLSSFKGKVVILSVVPSIDTAICDLQTKHFNNDAGTLGPNAVVLTLSMDLPMAQKRWCGATGATHVTMLSDFKDHSAGTTLGLRIKELGLLARSVIVIDKQGVVRYQEIVNEVAKEPNYAPALEAAKKLV